MDPLELRMAPQVTVSNSEVETYRQCRLKHQLQYIERWRSDDEREALARGTLFHSVMEAHYKAVQILQKNHGLRWYKEIEEDVARADLYIAISPLLFDQATGDQTDRQVLVDWIYQGYVQHWELDPNWEIVAVEYPLDDLLYYPDGTPSNFRLAGTVDLIIRDKSAAGGLWVVDHKTCKDLPKKDFDLEDQTAIYTLLLKKAGWDIRGAIYNHCRTYKLKTRDMGFDERFKRSRTVRGNQELETCAFEVLDLMEEAYGRDLRATGTDFGMKDAPRSPNGDTCGWKCDMTEACIAGRKGGPDRTRQFLQDIGFTIHETKPGPTFNKEDSE